MIILEMNNGRSAAVFKNICGGILSCDSDPAGVNLCLESVSGNLRIENVERIFAVKLFELEIVVVIEQLYAARVQVLAYGEYIVDGLLPAVGACALQTSAIFFMSSIVRSKPSVPGRLSSGR